MTNDAPAQASVEAVRLTLRDAANLFSLGTDDRYSISMRDANALVLACREAAAALRTLSPPPTVGSEDEAPVAWRVRERPGFPWRLLDGDPERMPGARGLEREALYTRPSPSAVEVKGLDEIETLVNEYEPKNSDWYFRRTVIREIVARLRSCIASEKGE